jgi:hypothetical protein
VSNDHSSATHKPGNYAPCLDRSECYCEHAQPAELLLGHQGSLEWDRTAPLLDCSLSLVHLAARTLGASGFCGLSCIAAHVPTFKHVLVHRVVKRTISAAHEELHQLFLQAAYIRRSFPLHQHVDHLGVEQLHFWSGLLALPLLPVACALAVLQCRVLRTLSRTVALHKCVKPHLAQLPPC